MFSVIFPGQGSQSIGMAKDLYNKFDMVKELFKEADNVLNFSITKLILDGTKAELDQTENTQPAIFLVGFSIFQLIGLFRLIQTLRKNGRFSFGQSQNTKNTSLLSLEEAYKILNLDKNKIITRQDVNKAYIKIQKKIHPDISPETARLSAIVNEAKEVVLKNIN